MAALYQVEISGFVNDDLLAELQAVVKKSQNLLKILVGGEEISENAPQNPPKNDDLDLDENEYYLADTPDNREMLAELMDYLAHPEKYKHYDTAHEMMEDILKEK